MKELLAKLNELNDSVKGTTEYSKYTMQEDSKINGRWVFMGHHVPATYLNDVTIKKVKGKIYLMSGDDRWHVTEIVKEVLGLE